MLVRILNLVLQEHFLKYFGVLFLPATPALYAVFF